MPILLLLIFTTLYYNLYNNPINSVSHNLLMNKFYNNLFILSISNYYYYFFLITFLPLLIVMTGFEKADLGCCNTGLVEAGVLCNKLEPLTCTTASTYVFWDSIHPTEGAYRIISSQILKQPF